ncbi:hypothetical protein AB4090_00600 [Acidithiobacillus sp. IBUN Pt1247-S3]|uniref:hypothetical protein n=1 Tax=Acidithiobacillus sp. IBUN Pt1247-S3 TaxID=3166642 RepID=UPI0034E5945B
MDALPKENARYNQPINYTAIRAARHLLAGIAALRRVDNPTAETLALIGLVATDLRLALEALRERGARHD